MFYRTKKLSSSAERLLMLGFPAFIKKRRERRFSEKFRDGDQEAFSKVYKKFHKPILNHVSGKLRDPSVSEEITHDIFLKAYRFRSSFDPQYQFSTWLWTIAKNTLADWFRKNSQSSTLEEEAVRLGLSQEEIPSLHLDAELALIEHADQKVLVKMMDSLAGLQKKALLMRLIHQLPYHEIAKRLNLSLSSVKCLVHRAKSTLMERCGENSNLLELGTAEA